jgi:hypothetical protein
METKFHKLWIINAHGRIEDKTEKTNGDFYQTLESTCNALPQNDIKLTAADLTP